jgi:hypothetical protein
MRLLRNLFDLMELTCQRDGRVLIHLTVTEAGKQDVTFDSERASLRLRMFRSLPADAHASNCSAKGHSTVPL